MSDTYIFIRLGNEKESSLYLKKFITERLMLPSQNLCFTPLGKPYLKDSEIGISITHDNSVTALIQAPFKPVGIDMQRVKKDYPKRVTDRFFTENERLETKTSADFYRIWCKKESFVKMTGEGIGKISSFDSTKSEFIFTDLSEIISKILNDEYIFYICSKEKISNPEIIILD